MLKELRADIIQAANLIGLKARRTIPGQDDPLNPDGVEMRRLEKWGQNIMLAALRKMQRDLLKNVSNPFDVQIRLGSQAIQDPFKQSVNKMINRYTQDGAEFGRFQVESEFFGIKQIDMWELANEEAAAWALQHSAQLVQELNNTTQRRIQRLVSQTIQDGGTIGELQSAIRASNIFSESRANMIAVTELTQAFAQGNLISWRASDVVEEKQWRTNEDELVCPQCGPLANKTVKINETFENKVTGASMDSPPAHPRCRCWIVPVVPTVSSRQPRRRTRAGFSPATTKQQIADRMAIYVDDYGLGDLSLSKQNEILKAVEEIAGREGFRLSGLGYEPRRGKAMGLAYGEKAGDFRITFRKSFLKSPQKEIDKGAEIFARTRANQIESLEFFINNPRMAHLADANRAKLKHWKEAERWIVADTDGWESTIRHELNHIADFNSGNSYRNLLDKEFKDLDMNKWEISEYGSSNRAEFWAEFATMIQNDNNVPSDLLDIYNRIIN